MQLLPGKEVESELHASVDGQLDLTHDMHAAPPTQCRELKVATGGVKERENNPANS
jgi:hypothetical protein